MKENSNEWLLSESAKEHLQTAGNWVYAMCIVGLTILIYGIICLIYDYLKISNWDDVPSGGGVGFLMIMTLLPLFFIIGVAGFFPLYYLYKFSSKVRVAFRDDDPEALEISFRYLKLHYKSLGILILIYIAYLLVIRIF